MTIHITCPHCRQTAEVDETQAGLAHACSMCGASVAVPGVQNRFPGSQASDRFQFPLRKVLNIVPSLDTPTCAKSTRVFNEKASGMTNTVVLVIAADLPFAMSRFCGAEGLKNVVTLSTFRGKDFHSKYGVDIADGPLRGLTARGVVVLDENNKVKHAELVAEIAQEPDYDAALASL